MSFRARLTLFFVLIVVIPMVVVAVLVVGVTTASRNGKADARLDAGVHTALSVYRVDLATARVAARAVARDPAVQTAVRGGGGATLRDALSAAASSSGAHRSSSADPGSNVTRVGTPGVAVARVTISGPGGSEFASVFASATSARGYVAKVHRLTGLDVAVIGPGGRAAGTLPFATSDLPESGTSDNISIRGETMRVTTAQLPGAGGLELALFGPVTSGGFFSSRPAVAAVLVAFFAVALMFVALLLRALGGQVGAMLDAARRIGRGDFSRQGAGGGRRRDGRAGRASSTR